MQKFIGQCFRLVFMPMPDLRLIVSKLAEMTLKKQHRTDRIHKNITESAGHPATCGIAIRKNLRYNERIS